MKKILSATVAILLILALCVPALAVTLDYDKAELKKGTLHDLNAEPKYSWINKLVIRDDATSVTTCRMVPHAAYPYSRTYEEFISDIEHVMDFYEFDTENVEDSYMQIVDLLYYTAVALNMTDDTETMYAYLQKQGIRIPVNMTAEDKIEAAVVYAAMKYKLTYALFGKNTEFTKGRTIEGAVVDILATATSAKLPSGIDSVQGLALNCCKAYAESFDDLPLSDNPSEEELFYAIKLISSAKKGYDVPVVNYEEATDIQKQYVDCTYYATVLGTVYEIEVNPLELAKVAAEQDVLSVARLVLETMLDDGNISYKKNAPVENLFSKACENGYFEMDEEFFSDVYNYDVYVDNTCEKLWVTPFALAKQIGGEDKYLEIKLGDIAVNPSSTTAVPLDTKADKENLVITSAYDDEMGNSDMTIYVLNIIKQEPNKTTSDNSLVAEIEDMLADVVPQENEKAQEIVSEVVSAADSVVDGAENAATAPFTTTNPAEEETKQTIERTTYDVSATVEGGTTLSGLDYFAELVGETYADKSLTSQYNEAEEATTSNSNSFITNAVETVKESPEIVVAPTSVVAAGALAGYLFTKRKKSDATDESSDDNNIED